MLWFEFLRRGCPPCEGRSIRKDRRIDEASRRAGADASDVHVEVTFSPCDDDRRSEIEHLGHHHHNARDGHVRRREPNDNAVDASEILLGLPL
ncbi:MAG: hypothetical protein AAGE52_29860, partial [Myxococcota bacterium]